MQGTQTIHTEKQVIMVTLRFYYNKGITFHTRVFGGASSTEYDINQQAGAYSTGGFLGVGTNAPEQPFHLAATNYKPALIQRTAGTNCYLLLEDQNTTQDVGVGLPQMT